MPPVGARRVGASASASGVGGRGRERGGGRRDVVRERETVHACSAIAASDGAGSVSDAGASAAEGTDVRAPVVVVAVVSSKRSDSESAVVGMVTSRPPPSRAKPHPACCPCGRARARAVSGHPWAFCPDAPRRRRRTAARALPDEVPLLNRTSSSQYAKNTPQQRLDWKPVRFCRWVFEATGSACTASRRRTHHRTSRASWTRRPDEERASHLRSRKSLPRRLEQRRRESEARGARVLISSGVREREAVGKRARARAPRSKPSTASNSSARGSAPWREAPASFRPRRVGRPSSHGKLRRAVARGAVARREAHAFQNA